MFLVFHTGLMGQREKGEGLKEIERGRKGKKGQVRRRKEDRR